MSKSIYEKLSHEEKEKIWQDTKVSTKGGGCYSGRYEFKQSNAMKVFYFFANMLCASFFGFWSFIAVIGVSGQNAEISGAYIAVNSLAVVGFFYFVARLVKSLK